jgi:hypothetical protein
MNCCQAHNKGGISESPSRSRTTQAMSYARVRGSARHQQWSYPPKAFLVRFRRAWRQDMPPGPNAGSLGNCGLSVRKRLLFPP